MATSSRSSFSTLTGRKLNSRYKLIYQIGTGHFGSVFLAHDTHTNTDVAIKLATAPFTPNLRYEYQVLTYIQHHPHRGIPRPLSFTLHGTTSAFTLTLLGTDLEKLRRRYGGRLSLSTVYKLAVMLVDRLKSIHSRHYVHRDLKPDNLMMGKTHPSELYVVDFGIAKRFRDHQTLEHFPQRANSSVVGPCEFWSVWAHRGFEVSRRDDLEMGGYALVFLYRGVLPWSGIRCRDKEVRKRLVFECKCGVSVRELCAGMGEGFVRFFEYVRSLEFASKPDYGYLVAEFNRSIERMGWGDSKFEWETEGRGISRSASSPDILNAASLTGRSRRDRSRAGNRTAGSSRSSRRVGRHR